MKIRVITFIAILAILFAGFAPRLAFAQAYTTSFTTSITYQNVGDATTTLLKLYFFEAEDDTSPTSVDLPALPAGAGASLFVGGLDELVVASGFQGAAYLQSDQPILATLVQIPMNSTTVKNRALSNGFSSGAPTSLIATVLKNMLDNNTIFSVQNVDTEPNTLSIKFYHTRADLFDEITPAPDVQPGASYYVDAGQLSGLGPVFNGSAIGYLEPEFRALGIPFDRKGARTNECIEAIRALWTQPSPAYAGRFVAFSGVQAMPRPLSRPHPPFVLGGASAPSFARAVRYGHGWYGFNRTPEQAAECLAGLSVRLPRESSDRDRSESSKSPSPRHQARR